MNKVKIALLKNQLSRHLAAVRRGAEIVVMDRNTPVARIIPYGPREAAATPGARKPGDDWSRVRMAELVRQGTAQAGDPPALEAWLRRRRPTKLPAGTPRATEALIRARRESTR